jgi:hypothetical protein
MVARIILLALLVLLVAAPAPAGSAEAAPDPLALVEGAPPAPLADDDAGTLALLAVGAAITPPDPGAPGTRFSAEAVPPGPPRARVFRPPRLPRA